MVLLLRIGSAWMLKSQKWFFKCEVVQMYAGAIAVSSLIGEKQYFVGSPRLEGKP